MTSLALVMVGCVVGAAASVAALPSLDLACISPDTHLIDAVCPPSAVALRGVVLRREANARRADATFTGTAGSNAVVGPTLRSVEVQARIAELQLLQRQAAARAPSDPARASEMQQISQRVQELRGLPYGGQEAADEAIATMASVMPELANDPVMRAGLRVGGVALDAGQAIDHAIGPNIDRAAQRAEGLLSKLRPRH